MGNYDDIINLPHHTSQLHPRMSMYNRAGGAVKAKRAKQS